MYPADSARMSFEDRKRPDVAPDMNRSVFVGPGTARRRTTAERNAGTDVMKKLLKIARL
jgi:hypothetical protein